MSEVIAGNLHVANEVLLDIVGYAALECYGVVGMTSPTTPANKIAKLLPVPKLRRGVVVNPADDGVEVELYVIIEYGTNIQTVSKNLSEQVAFALHEYAKVNVKSVEVHVQDVRVRM